jgi:peroxiredoxin
MVHKREKKKAAAHVLNISKDRQARQRQLQKSESLTPVADLTDQHAALADACLCLILLAATLDSISAMLSTWFVT